MDFSTIEFGGSIPFPHATKWEGQNQAMFQAASDYARSTGVQFEARRKTDESGKEVDGFLLVRIK